MKKIFSLLFMFLFAGAMVFTQEPKAVPTPTKSKSKIRVDFPTTGHTVIADNLHLIRWTRTGIQNTTVKIILIKPQVGNVLVIANAAPNKGIYYWIVPYDLPIGSYKIGIQAGSHLYIGGTFTVKTPTFTLYEPHAYETLKIGTVKKIKWHAADAAGLKVQLVISYKNGFSGGYKLAKNIPADQEEYDWVVGKYDDNSKYVWGDTTDVSKLTCHIIIGKMPEPYKLPKFESKGPDFYVKR